MADLGNKLFNVLSGSSFSNGVEVKNEATGEVKVGTNIYPSEGLINIQNREGEVTTEFGISTLGIETVDRVANKQYRVRYSNGQSLLITSRNQLSA